MDVYTYTPAGVLHFVEVCCSMYTRNTCTVASTPRAVCCSVLQCVAVCSDALQWGTACFSKSITKKLHSAGTPHMPCVAAHAVCCSNSKCVAVWI